MLQHADVAWTQEDIDKLKEALSSGVLEVEYDGPPRRRLKYQDIDQMRALLADMEASVSPAPAYRRVAHASGFGR